MGACGIGRAGRVVAAGLAALAVLSTGAPASAQPSTYSTKPIVPYAMTPDEAQAAARKAGVLPLPPRPAYKPGGLALKATLFCSPEEKDRQLKELTELKATYDQEVDAYRAYQDALYKLLGFYDHVHAPRVRISTGTGDLYDEALEFGVLAGQVEKERDRIRFAIEYLQSAPAAACPADHGQTASTAPSDTGAPTQVEQPKLAPSEVLGAKPKPPPSPPAGEVPTQVEQPVLAPAEVVPPPKAKIELPPAPTLTVVGLPEPPPSFCSETDRVAFLTDVFNPAAAQATANATAAADHLDQLGKAIRGATDTYDILAARAAFNAYQPTAEQLYGFANKVHDERPAIMAAPVTACGAPTQVAQIPSPPSGAPRTSPGAPLEGPAVTPAGFCPMPPAPLVLGPNSRFGSGARSREKVMNTAMGLVGGLLGGGGGGGGGASDGPQTLRCRIKDSEMTVFSDPASGISLKVGAKRAGDLVTVFAGIASSPDSGTFQSAFLQNDRGEEQGPRDVGICELWGEWSLTVSWTRETYVNNQLVSRQEGGWSRNGTFSLPGVLSADGPDRGLWKRLGFSNASHGARVIAAQYRLPKDQLIAGPVRLIIHVTRPGQDPVTTVPFAVLMREGPQGLTFEKARYDCL